MILLQYRGNESLRFTNMVQNMCENEGTRAGMSWDVMGQANTNIKLLTLEAFSIWKERPRLITRNEFRSRELIPKL